MQSMNQYQLDKLYQQARMREAEKARLARQARANQSEANPLYAPLLAELGRRLVQMGQNLQEQYAAQDSLVTES